MKSISGKDFIKLLEKQGWQMKPSYRERISVPVHGHQDLKTGLLKHFMEIAGIDESEL